MTSCTQHSLGEGGAGWQVRCWCETRDTCAVQVTQLVCVLPANIAHMKLYLLLCCWLAALASAGAAQLGHRLLTLASPAYR